MRVKTAHAQGLSDLKQKFEKRNREIKKKKYGALERVQMRDPEA